MHLSHWLRGLKTGLFGDNRRKRRRSRRRPAHRFAAAHVGHASDSGVQNLEDRTLLTTTLYLDFGLGFTGGDGNDLQMTVQQFRDINGGPVAMGQRTTGPDLTAGGNFNLTDNIILQPSDEFDLNGDGNNDATDVGILANNVFTLASRILEPFDVNVVLASANSIADVQNTLAANNPATNGNWDAYVFVTEMTGGVMGTESNVGATMNLLGLASTFDLRAPLASGSAGGQPNNQTDEVAMVFLDNITNGAGVLQHIVVAANVAVHEGGHTFGLIHNADPAGSVNEDQILSGSVMDNGPLRDFRSINHIPRFNLMNESPPPTFTNDYTKLANDPDIGLRDRNNNGIPDIAYVTGTGAHDRIQLTRLDANTVRVNVSAFSNAAHTAASFIRANTYTIPLNTSTDGRIVIDAGFGTDEIIIEGDIGGRIEVRGMHDLIGGDVNIGGDADSLIVRNGNINRAVYTPDASAPVVFGQPASFGGHVQYGTTSIDVSEFEPAGSIEINDADEVVFSAPGDIVEWIQIERFGDGERIRGLTNGINFVPLIIDDVRDVSVDLDGGDDRIDLHSFDNSTHWTVNGGSGNDRLFVSPVDRDLDWLEVNSNIQFTYQGGGGANDRISILNSFSTDPHPYIFTKPEFGQPAGIFQSDVGWLLGYEAVDTMTFNGSASRADEYDIRHVPAGTSLTLDGNDGNDEFIVGDGDFIEDILGNLTIQGEGGDDTLEIRDADALTGLGGLGQFVEDEYHVSNTLFVKNRTSHLLGSTTVGKVITFDTMKSITVDGSGTTGDEFEDRPSSVYEILNIDAGSDVTVHGNGGKDKFIVGNGDYDSTILGTLSITGGSEADELIIADTNDLGEDEYFLTRDRFGKDSVLGGLLALDYLGIQAITIEGSDARGTFNVSSVATGVDVTVLGNEGNDTFVIGDGNYTANIRGSVDINGNAGDTLIINDADDEAGVKFDRNTGLTTYIDEYTLTQDSFQKTTRISPSLPGSDEIGPTMTFSAGLVVILDASGSAGSEPSSGPSTTVNIHGVAEGSTLTVNGHQGDERFIVWGGSDEDGGDYDSFFHGTLTIDGGTGANELVIDDRDDLLNDRYILRRGAVLQPQSGRFTKDSQNVDDVPNLNFEEIGFIELKANNADNTIDINSTASGLDLVVHGNGGADAFFIRSVPGGSIDIHGGDPDSSPGDSLWISANEASVVTLTPSNRNDGVFDVDGRFVTYTGIDEPIDARTMHELTLVSTNNAGFSRLYVRNGGSGRTAISTHSNPANGPDFLRVLDVDEINLDGSQLDNGFGISSFTVTLDGGSLNGTGLVELGVDGGSKGLTAVHDRILEGPAAHALLRIDGVSTHNIYGAGERLEVNLRDAAASQGNSRTIGRVVDSNGDPVHRFEDNVGTLRIHATIPEIHATLEGTEATLQDSILGQRLTGPGLTTLDFENIQPNNRLRVSTVGDMKIDVRDPLFPVFQFDPIFGTGVDPLGVFHVRAVTSTEDNGPRSLRDAILRAEAAPADGTAVVYFDIPETDPNFIDIGDEDPASDVFVILPANQLPAFTRGNTVLNGTSQQTVTGDTSSFGAEIILFGPLAGANDHGLVLQSSGNRVHGIHFQEFGGDGLRIDGNNNIIGDSDEIAQNAFIRNGGNGITVLGGTGNTLGGNLFTQNTGLGIDLGNDGVNANDVNDADAGPNDRQNIPVIGLAQGGASTRVAGSLHSTPSSRFTLDFYADPEVDPTGFGEGLIYLGTGVVTTDANGNGDFDFTFDVATESTDWISATATDANGSTSEFARSVQANAPENAFIVANSNDSGPGSLRQAILDANQVPGTETVEILFRILPTDPNFVDVDGDTSRDVYVISPLTELPAITRGNVVIDGDSQQWLGGNTNILGPEIVLAGNLAGADADGLVLASSNNVVHGLNVQQFSGDGVLITGNTNTVSGSYLGTNATGDAAAGNGLAGVRIENADHNLIGGTDAQARNVISGNDSIGVAIIGDDADFNMVKANYVGIATDGETQLDRQLVGVFVGGFHFVLQAGEGNIIGGTTEGERNVVSGNRQANISLSATQGTTVEGNFVGTDATGSFHVAVDPRGVVGIGLGDDKDSLIANNLIAGQAIGIQINGRWHPGGTERTRIEGNLIGTDATGQDKIDGFSHYYGIILSGHINSENVVHPIQDVTIGGTAEGAGNVISGNINNGIIVSGPGSQRIKIQGNHIGTDIDGIDAIPNGNGIWLNGTNGVTIGGTEDGAGNLISGNVNDGILIEGGSANIVEGNRIGTTGDGMSARGNGDSGVRITDSGGNLIGGSEAAARNVISGNGQGIGATGTASTGNVFTGNFIGVDRTGSGRLRNTGDGVVLGVGTSGNRVGGTTADERNVISGNGRFGVLVTGSRGNDIEGNYIGTDVGGTFAVVNGAAGVAILDDNGTVIGGSEAGAGNVISGNGTGVWLYGGLGAKNTRIEGNIIGASADGESRVPNADGILVMGAGGNEVFNLDITGNVVSGNNGAGIHVRGENALNIRITGNRIGTNPDGDAAVPNSEEGILINDGAGGVIIGGPDPGARNVISGNLGDGIQIVGSASQTKSQDFFSSRAIIAGWIGHENLTNRDSFASNVPRPSLPGDAWKAGGRFARARTALGEFFDPVSFYADPHLGGTLTLDNAIHAEGELLVANPQDWNQNVHIGHFNRSDAESNLTTNAIGLAVLEPDTTQGSNGIRAAAYIRLASGPELFGGWVNAPDGLQTDVNYTWRYDFDPHGGAMEVGELVLEVFADGVSLGTSIVELTTAQRETGASFDAFGLRNGGVIAGSNNPNTVEVYTDNVTYTRVAANTIQGNRIGTASDGITPLGNAGNGIDIRESSGNVIGDTIAEAGNTIANNNGIGVSVMGDNAVANIIRGNAIHSNAGIGIDLAGDGVTPNDDGDPNADPPIPPDADMGPNGLQNTPVISGARVRSGQTSITGRLKSTPNTTFTIDFYVSPAADPGGFRQGARWIGAVDVTTNADGATVIPAMLEEVAVGDLITATATGPEGTSEFSEAVVVRGRRQPRKPGGGGGRPLNAMAMGSGDPTSSQKLTEDDVHSLLDAAIAAWGDDADGKARFHTLQTRIVDLPETELGRAAGNTIYIDTDAAGWGWFVDATPGDNSEFTTPGDQGEQGHIDLLTVLSHELGHLLGHDHYDEGVMEATLPTGTRRLPEAEHEEHHVHPTKSYGRSLPLFLDGGVSRKIRDSRPAADQQMARPVRVNVPTVVERDDEVEVVFSDLDDRQTDVVAIGDVDGLFADFAGSLADDLLTV